MSRTILPLRAFAAVLVLGVCASAQPANPANQNDLTLHNGLDGFFIFSDPSVGAATGTNPPNLNGDLFWKVFPKEAMHFGTSAAGGNPPGTAEISGIRVSIADTDWSTSPAMHDLILTPGRPSPTAAFAGNIEPDYTSPAAIFISFGPSGLPDPCTIPGSGCTGGCPTGLNYYDIDLFFGTGAGDGIVVQADGTVDWTLVSFLPGGMTATGGRCGAGDYVTQAAYSSNFFTGGREEKQADWLGTGFSAFSGQSIGNFNGAPTGYVPDVIQDTPALEISFVQPILTPMVDIGDGVMDRGLVTLNVSTGTGTVSMGFESFDYRSIGSTLLTSGVLAGTTLPVPGLGGLLLDPSDPVFNFLLSLNLIGNYAYVAGPQSAPGVVSTFHDGIALTPMVPLPVTTAAAGFAFQGAAIGGAIRFTNVFTTQIRP